MHSGRENTEANDPGASHNRRSLEEFQAGKGRFLRRLAQGRVKLEIRMSKSETKPKSENRRETETTRGTLGLWLRDYRREGLLAVHVLAVVLLPLKKSSDGSGARVDVEFLVDVLVVVSNPLADTKPITSARTISGDSQHDSTAEPSGAIPGRKPTPGIEIQPRW